MANSVNYSADGFVVEGDIIDVKLDTSKTLTTLEINGKKTISGIKDINKVKRSYGDEDAAKLEYMFSEIFKKNKDEVEKLVQQFEKDLQKVLNDTQKELRKF